MLIQFSVGNYLSFKETVTLSMVAANITAKDKSLDANNIFEIDDNLSLLKSAAIYGANASGKSNLLAAFWFMQWFVLNSSKETQVDEEINIEEFRLSTETIHRPSFFEIIFILDKIQYRYGFEITKEKVISEWLYYVPKVRETFLFERTLDKIKHTKVFKEAQGLVDKTRNNALFLSVVAQFNGKIARRILLWFRNKLGILSGLEVQNYEGYTTQLLEENRYKNEIIQFIQKLDLGIQEIKVEHIDVPTESIVGMPSELRKALLHSKEKTITLTSIKTVHKQYDKNGKHNDLTIFEMNEHESEGTKKLFALTGPILDALARGMVVIIDALDARLHPLMTSAIIELFNSNETNPRNAQLIFMTHDTNLLSHKIFRRDQIWFTEKDRKGVTDLYSLVEFKVGNDGSFESEYIQGKYGGIPFLGNFQSLVREMND